MGIRKSLRSTDSGFRVAKDALGFDVRNAVTEDGARAAGSCRDDAQASPMLRRIRLVESWGRGIPLILEKAPESRFSIEAGLFVSTLQRAEKTSDKILAYLSESPEMSAANLAEAIGLSQRAIEKQMAKLREQGRLRRRGPDKGGIWIVCDPEN